MSPGHLTMELTFREGWRWRLVMLAAPVVARLPRGLALRVLNWAAAGFRYRVGGGAWKPAGVSLRINDDVEARG